jgi:3-methyladenine DNA glycosylase/8-oxoguanine DNA glycosylase
MAADLVVDLPLRGPAGETVDLRRTLLSHGVVALPPARLDAAAATLELPVRLPGIGLRRLVIAPGPTGLVRVVAHDLADTPAARAAVTTTTRWLLRLDADLAPFYARAATDPALAWATAGAGRMARCATVFEDVIKTICTTNCSWSATIRMSAALVDHLGDPLPADPDRRAFPTAAAMAAQYEPFYREVVRAGYRAKSLRAVAEQVASGALDLEVLGTATRADLPDDEVRRCLLALPGIGPYAAAHVMMMLGRASSLILDSWTRPTYAKITGNAASDAEITARFALYGDEAGLAFWLVVTRDWITDPTAAL